MTDAEARTLLLDLFETALDAARPAHCLAQHLPGSGTGRIIVVGAGKAAASMAQAVEAAWPDKDLEGLVITRYDHGADCKKIEVIQASHPVPDEAGQQATQRILEKVQGLSENDLVLCLISGGGSALLTLPAEGITLDDMRAINKALLKSGAPIDEMNCVRRHLSAIKGARLAQAAWPARVVTLAISDVPGDDPATIASGPTVGDASSNADALAILKRYDIPLSPAVEALLSGDKDTPDPADPRLQKSSYHLISRPIKVLEAAADKARTMGLTPLLLGDAIEGEAREVAKVLGAMALSIAKHGQPIPAPAILLSGGETSVTVKGHGRGGRNAEFLLSLCGVLKGCSKIHALACDTDGIDGVEDNAGAILHPSTPDRAAKAGLDLQQHLTDNNAYSFFKRLDGLIFTGPTLTNVNDFRAILVLE